MESLLERVFDITAPANTQSSSLGARRNNISSNPSARRLGGYTELDPEIEFDKKREEMFKCQTDQEVLQWAMQEVFLRAPGESTSPTASSGTTSNDISTTLGEMHPKIYGRIIASLMKEFREQYNNPHLAMAIFDYARRLSIISYVTGCTSPSYNELMRTHWCSFRNLQAVVDVAEEMQVNGVLPDQITAALLNQIHDEVEPQAVWTEDGDGAEANKLLNRLDELLRPSEYEPIAPLNERKRYGKTPRRTTDGHGWSSRSFRGADSI
ncbi:hypothetical protein FRC12_012114 [Ceratobasidium sp. 428]|nr:hypothetical protein FRC12_012114 [Ceratobasidium sp. 428]